MKKRLIALAKIGLLLVIVMLVGVKLYQNWVPQNVNNPEENEFPNQTDETIIKNIPIETKVNELTVELVTNQGEIIVFELNDSSAAKSFYKQLPLTVDIENYGAHEKIFYPPDQLDINDTPLASGPEGTIAYYAPWGDVAIFLSDCQETSGLYQLGSVVSGFDYISHLNGTIQLKAVINNK